MTVSSTVYEISLDNIQTLVYIRIMIVTYAKKHWFERTGHWSAGWSPVESCIPPKKLNHNAFLAGLSIVGGAENAGPNNAGPDNGGTNRTGWKMHI